MTIRTFRYEIPTIIEFGNGIVNYLPDYVNEFNGSKILIVADPGVLKAGIIDRVTSNLDKKQIPYVIFSEVEADPAVESVEQGVSLAKSEGCDLVIGVGGGSSLDTAKSIRVMLRNDGSIRDYVGNDQIPKPGVPFVAIPTTAGTGSELTIYSVLSDKKAKVKLSIGSVYNCPNLALCDPELTLTLPPKITATTGMDALTHALESYVNKFTQPISEGHSIQAMKMIANNLRLAVVQGENVEARYNMLLASLIAALAFNATRLGVAHALAIPLGAKFQIPHGTVNAILLPEVMQYNLIGNTRKFAEIADIFGERTELLSEREAAEKGVKAVKRLKEDIGITQKLSDYGVQDSDLDNIAQEAMQSGNIPINPRQPTNEDLKNICRAVL